MSTSSWTIISISLSCFTVLFMLTMFIVLAVAWKLKKSRPITPHKVSYSARKRSNSESVNVSVGKTEFLSSRARSFTSLHAYETNLAIQSERDSRRVMEKSSMFDYWWDDNDNPVIASKKCNGKNNTKGDANLYSTYPPDYGKGKSKREKAKSSDLKVPNGKKSYSVDDIVEKRLQTADSKVKGDLQL